MPYGGPWETARRPRVQGGPGAPRLGPAAPAQAQVDLRLVQLPGETFPGDFANGRALRGCRRPSGFEEPRSHSYRGPNSTASPTRWGKSFRVGGLEKGED
ncbi:hypothetical protein GWK47_001101 [Chionoecetes opilio]|uniref:Uncharacterized protein n=1 Tax=Chionoecetes opilio TaxID=41210 RepID=A0A8J4XXW1_CHIOP|nr:hypothetical protein GWK47_001101 [Chionoecetes opilio]